MNVKSDYELYHDESAKEGYWHGMLLVPCERKKFLLDHLEAAREAVDYPHKISFKKINRPGKKYDLADAWLSLALGFMRSQTKSIKYYYFTGKKEGEAREYQLLDEQAVGVKFVLFRERESLADMLNYPDETSKVETSFRIGMKGGLHYLFSSRDPVRITRIHFDGYLHQGRHIDRQRVIDRLNGLRDYCEIAATPDLIDDRASDPRSTDAQDYADCQLLQLTDLLIGSFRAAFGFYSNETQWKLAKYAHTLIRKYAEGPARMRNSRWNHTFCMSQCYLEQGSWQFETIELLEKTQASQPSLLV